MFPPVVLLSFGLSADLLQGWTHNDPGPYQKVFSDMASTAANRKKFIQNILGFMTQYGFDGVDIDWEYPGAEDRGGIPEDGENFTLLLQDLKAAFDGRYILTFTIPTSYWYLRHFDIKKSVKAADWVNLMSYDLHGVWDQDNPIGSHVMGHSNITEIDLALNLLWRNDIPPNKIVLGTGFYGRTFALEDPSCTGPGCKFSGPGSKGPCTDTAGFLSYKGKYLSLPFGRMVETPVNANNDAKYRSQRHPAVKQGQSKVRQKGCSQIFDVRPTQLE